MEIGTAFTVVGISFAIATTIIGVIGQNRKDKGTCQLHDSLVRELLNRMEGIEDWMKKIDGNVAGLISGMLKK
jgi:hypothetical protein